MSSLTIEESSHLSSTTRKYNKSEQWTEEQRAFLVYHRSHNVPASTIARLLNAQFGTSRIENSIPSVVRRIRREEGEENRLLELANRYSWWKTTDEERNTLNRTTQGRIVYTDEQRSYALYYFTRDLPQKHILSLFNDEFSTNVSFSSLDRLIRRMRSKQNEREKILKDAEQYPWYIEPIPQNHRSLTPIRKAPRVRLDSSNNSTATSPEDYVSPNSDWTEEHKAFLIHHSYRGMKPDVLLECFNSTFGLDRRRAALMVVLHYIWKDDEVVAHLRQHAAKYPWYTPEAAPATPESKRTERAQRLRDARKRISGKKEIYKRVPREGDFSIFNRWVFPLLHIAAA